MNRALEAAASGMAAQQHRLDVVAGNLANADAVGFKGEVDSFAPLGNGGSLGTRLSGTHRAFGAGKLEKSGGPFDLALDGDGFFEVRREGTRAFARTGSFARRADGTVADSDGWVLAGVRIPSDATSVTVRADGRVIVDGARYRERAAGRIALFTCDAPEFMTRAGTAVFEATPESGLLRRVAAGTERGPKFVFGQLERSNVSIVESMMAILTAQRAYEANAKGVQAADEMLRIANNLHRS